MRRTEQIHQLEKGKFDLLIVGGGIVGAGIARDAALRGLEVALVEQGDFASGTSSKTSKLIHGGLRYLAHGRVPLVTESLKERDILYRTASSVVQPFPLLLPVYKGDARPFWKIHGGLLLYGSLAGISPLGFPKSLSVDEAAALEPALQREMLQAAGFYRDCQMDDARLCLANVLQAVDFGAVCCNYVRLRSFLKAKGKVSGGVVEDRLTGRYMEIQAKAVVNAAGPWADHVRRLSQTGAPNRLNPIKGIHLVLPHLTRHGIFFQAKSDGRMLFLVPWGDYTLLGTTESPAGEVPETLRAEGDEVGYLLEEVNRVLAHMQVAERDVLSSFAGARPLLAFSGSPTTASREHRVEADNMGLVSVLGGKYTTYRKMAAEAVDLLCKRNRWKAKPCQTNQLPLAERVDLEDLAFLKEVIEPIGPALASQLFNRYGTQVVKVLQLIDQDRPLVARVCPHHAVLRAEIVHAIQNELACSITDLLARRTRIAWSRCHGLDFLPQLKELLERYGQLSRAQIDQQTEEYQRFLTEGLAFRSHSS